MLIFLNKNNTNCFHYSCTAIFKLLQGSCFVYLKASNYQNSVIKIRPSIHFVYTFYFYSILRALLLCQISA